MLHEEPRLSGQESLLKICGKLRYAGRMSKQIAAPVAGSGAEAAPHATRFLHKTLPQRYRLANERYHTVEKLNENHFESNLEDFQDRELQHNPYCFEYFVTMDNDV